MHPVSHASHTTHLASAALQLDAVSVPFSGNDNTGEGITGLRDISLVIAAGERVVLLGPSGEGKTSLLRAIAGLTPLSRGRILVNGLDVTEAPPETRDAVYLHQVPVLFPHLSVADNIGFPLMIRGTARAERMRVVESLLTRLQLDGLADRAPHMLSGGQRHRVALARALAARPHVLLLDEPLSALDPVLRRDVRESIRLAHAESEAGLLLVTHDLDDATALGDRLAIMLDRTIAQVAPADELFARPANRDVMRFLGLYQEFAGIIEHAHLVRTSIGPLHLPASAREMGPNAHAVTVAIRNDAIRCDAAPVQGEGAAPDVMLAHGSVHANQSHDIALRGRVVQLHHRATGSSATVQLGTATLHALIDPLRAPTIGAIVSVHVDPRGLLLFPA